MSSHSEQIDKSNSVTNYLDFVATDADLLTFLEMKELGYTTEDRASPTREDLLKDCDLEQLRSEIGREYSIDRDTVLNVEQLCLTAIQHRVESFLYV